MARSIRSSQMESRTARLKLPVRGKPVFVKVAKGVALGYRRNATAGTWVVRVADGHGANWTKVIGIADDNEDAATGRTLTYWEAQDKARGMARGGLGVVADAGKPVTVAEGVAAYERDLRARQADTYNAQRILVHMPATLASKTVALLAAKDLKGWRDGMIEAGHNRSSVARTCRALKAALNLVADHDQRITNRAAWRIGLGNLPDTEEARNVILSNEQVLEVVRACHTHDPALGLLIEVLAATGARLSQVKRLRVEDVLDAPPRLNMPSAKKGRKKRIDRFPVPITGALHAKLRSNRPPSATLLRRVDGREWAPLAQRQQFTRAIKGTDTPTITAYALRHSSIVRQLLANVPIRIVAAGHDTSVTMIERNYAKYIQSHADDLVRATLL